MILMIQQNYFQICIQQNFRFLSKIVLSMNVIEDIYRNCLLHGKNRFAKKFKILARYKSGK